jgi:hypothetical protein
MPCVERKFPSGHDGDIPSMKNLFDEDIDPRNELEKDLCEYDDFTFQFRLARLKYILSVYPPGYGMMSLEMHYLFTEAMHSYINGEFVATILISQSLIEHWLFGTLREKGYPLKENAGLGEIIKTMRKYQLLHSFLIDKIDQLKKIRNPYVHSKPMSHPDNLDHRSVNQNKNHQVLAENDAKEALALMYEIIQRAGHISEMRKIEKK